MSLPHHGSPESNNIRKLFDNQKSGTAKRRWPEGRSRAEDDGEIAFKIGSDKERQLVGIEFPKPVTFLEMSPQDAILLAQALIKQARSISDTALQILLH